MKVSADKPIAAAAAAADGEGPVPMVPVEPPKRSLECLRRLCLKNGGKRVTGVKEREALKAEMEAQSVKIREAKNAKLVQTNPREWWIGVRKLLQLKYDAGLFLADKTSGVVMNSDDLFTEIKLRWYVKDANGTSKRLQRLVQCRYSLTAQELLSIVTDFTAVHYPQLGAPLAIAVRADLLDIALRFPKNSTAATDICPDPEAMRTLCLDDVLYVPLEFPGPYLPKTTVIELDVTFAAPPSNVTTPECYTTEEQKAVLPELVDAGVNICDGALKEHPLATLHEAMTAGVSQEIALSVDLESSRFNVLLARSARGNAFATVGFHPLSIPQDVDPAPAMEQLAAILDEDAKRENGKSLIVGIGEIGLDYEHGQNREIQMNWFDHQLLLARKYSLPVVLHLRGDGAIEDAVKLLKERSVDGDWRGAINCFNGTLDHMRALTDLGFYITWTGLLCNDARAEVLRDVAAKGMLERYLIGSDAPQLIPFNMAKPFPKFNRPCTLPHVAAILAKLMKIPVQQIASVTTMNARALFNLPAVAFNGALPVAGVAFDPNVFTEEPLVTMPKVSTEPDVVTKGKKRLRLLNDEQIAALLTPEQKAFVKDGFVYACPPGIAAALDAMVSTKNPAVEQSIKDFVAAGTISLVHDPRVHKNRRRAHADRRAVRARVGVRAVRRRVDRRMVRRGGRRYVRRH